MTLCHSLPVCETKRKRWVVTKTPCFILITTALCFCLRCVCCIFTTQTHTPSSFLLQTTTHYHLFQTKTHRHKFFWFKDTLLYFWGKDAAPYCSQGHNATFTKNFEDKDTWLYLSDIDTLSCIWFEDTISFRNRHVVNTAISFRHRHIVIYII